MVSSSNQPMHRAWRAARINPYTITPSALPGTEPVGKTSERAKRMLSFSARILHDVLVAHATRAEAHGYCKSRLTYALDLHNRHFHRQ